MSNGWVIIPNWDKFQHYTDREPVWIKVYLELERRDEWTSLTLAERGLLTCIWLEYAQRKAQIRDSDLSRYVQQRVTKRALDSLQKAGFIKIRASKPLARGYHSRGRAKEKSKKPLPLTGKKAGTTGWRLVRGTHGISHVPDPLGTDVPPE